MKILGIGIDIIKNNRVKNSIKNNKFKYRVYSSKELQLSNSSKNKLSFFSKRFAAKEAFSKALGTGFRFDLNLPDLLYLQLYLILMNSLNDILEAENSQILTLFLL